MTKVLRVLTNLVQRRGSPHPIQRWVRLGLWSAYLVPGRPPTYHDRFEGRDVSATGGIRWTHPWVNVAITWAGAYFALEDIDDGVWNVDSGPLTRGRRRARHLRSEDA